MPAGDDVTEPAPVPALATVSVRATTKVAVTLRAALMLSVQEPVPGQAPPQPPNNDPAPGAAVSVTLLPCGKDAAQPVPQLMPAGAEVTVPVPAPARVTVSVCCATENVAVTAALAPSVTVQVVDAPVHAPLQPTNALPVCAAAVSVTAVFLATLAAQLVAEIGRAHV